MRKPSPDLDYFVRVQMWTSLLIGVKETALVPRKIREKRKSRVFCFPSMNGLSLERYDIITLSRSPFRPQESVFIRFSRQMTYVVSGGSIKPLPIWHEYNQSS